MIVIVRPQTKKRITLGFRILVTVFILTLVLGHLYNMYQGNNVIREGWLRDDRPSGNPMRVHNDPQTLKNDNPTVLDQFVVKLRDFYQKDQ